MSDTPTGTIITDGDRATIRFERRLPYPIEAVWAALTEQDQLTVWFSAGLIEPRQGGLARLAGPKNIPVDGDVLVWDPPHVLELDWRQRNIGRTTVRYELVADGVGTLLSFSHGGLRISDAHGYAPGVHAFLDRLTAYLAGTDIPDWEARYWSVQSAYA